MTAPRRRRHPCDICGHSRLRGQRLCETCFRILPMPLRTAIIMRWRAHDRAGHRAAVKAALDHIGTAVARHVRTISAERSYQLTAARLGERDI